MEKSEALNNSFLRYLKFSWTMLMRLFKQGIKIRHGDEVQIKATPKAVGLKELRQPHPIQLTAEGAGPLHYRHFRVSFKRTGSSAEEIIRLLQGDPGKASAPELAVFKKTKGVPGSLQVGDEFLIEITGPWNGPVRTIDVTPQSFSFGTLEGHMEAGEITFQVKAMAPDRYVFEIFSWARSKDKTVDFLYDKMKIAKRAQSEMWTLYCENVVTLAQGQQDSHVLIEDKSTEFKQEVIPVKDNNHDAPWIKHQSRLSAIMALKENFDLSKKESYTAENGWYVDQYVCELTAEKPGVPEPGKSFELAKEVLKNYEFPDPRIVTGIFAPDSPLDKRIMLLKAQFLFFSFYFGVRIGQVVNKKTATNDGPVQVWGYDYHTLEGHFERGEMSFQIWKHLRSGRVEFKIAAFSQPDKIRNFFYRWGFQIFGRRLQRHFAESSLKRLKHLVHGRLQF